MQRAARDAEAAIRMNAIKQRIADTIRRCDRQGDHRPGTDVDRDSARWLAARIEAL